MTPLFDSLVAIPGALAHIVSELLHGSRRATRMVLIGLLLLTAVPIYLVGSTPRPTDLTFEDMSLERIPAMTSWGRLEGELRVVKSASGVLYELHDPRDDALYVVVVTLAPLSPGHTMVTGHISPRRATTGNVGTIDADTPAVPPVDEPIWLYLSPAVVAILLSIGLATGYPVVRRDGSTPPPAPPLGPDETVAAAWSGRIGRDGLAPIRAEPCTVGLAPMPDLPDMGELRIAAPGGDRAIRIRRAAAVRRIRLCRVGRSEPALEIHASTADLVLAFADRRSRDRLAASLR